MGNDATLEVVGMGNLEVTMIMGDKMLIGFSRTLFCTFLKSPKIFLL
jgi:hypothetical protein